MLQLILEIRSYPEATNVVRLSCFELKFAATFSWGKSRKGLTLICSLQLCNPLSSAVLIWTPNLLGHNDERMVLLQRALAETLGPLRGNEGKVLQPQNRARPSQMAIRRPTFGINSVFNVSFRFTPSGCGSGDGATRSHRGTDKRVTPARFKVVYAHESFLDSLPLSSIRVAWINGESVDTVNLGSNPSFARAARGGAERSEGPMIRKLGDTRHRLRFTDGRPLPNNFPIFRWYSSFKTFFFRFLEPHLNPWQPKVFGVKLAQEKLKGFFPLKIAFLRFGKCLNN